MYIGVCLTRVCILVFVLPEYVYWCLSYPSMYIGVCLTRVCILVFVLQCNKAVDNVLKIVYCHTGEPHQYFSYIVVNITCFVTLYGVIMEGEILIR
jgi:hypothetical protein